eukprot:CAMPEP_0175116098 /NCGR_PEP_ID=MMETSP0086_2-20121207/17985_1 /TAXON_ID=136419 /ORGANISM="Unknown Unknown, Strain D1" /LENGTH=155 /DNA_ID=CAMNT_0016396345 /DNA_START=571 /DNA_END=1035 /DNA_ORIENTATION=+
MKTLKPVNLSTPVAGLVDHLPHWLPGRPRIVPGVRAVDDIAVACESGSEELIPLLVLKLSSHSLLVLVFHSLLHRLNVISPSPEKSLCELGVPRTRHSDLLLLANSTLEPVVPDIVALVDVGPPPRSRAVLTIRGVDQTHRCEGSRSCAGDCPAE